MSFIGISLNMLFHYSNGLRFILLGKLQNQCPWGCSFQSFHFTMCLTNQNEGFNLSMKHAFLKVPKNFILEEKCESTPPLLHFFFSYGLFFHPRTKINVSICVWKTTKKIRPKTFVVRVSGWVDGRWSKGSIIFLYYQVKYIITSMLLKKFVAFFFVNGFFIVSII